MLQVVRTSPESSQDTAPQANGRAFIVSTRPPKKPLSGGMAPAIREASREYDSVVWYALGNEAEKTLVRRDFEKTYPNSYIQAPISRYNVEGFDVRQIQLTKENWVAHYDEFCNRWIWPACHNLMQYAKKKISHWDIEGNKMVNILIASDIAKELALENDTTSPIMIQDYHHFRLAMYLRHENVKNPIIFFNHIPLPTVETLQNMQARERTEFKDMMQALLKCDSVQFQTQETAQRFLKIIGYNNPPQIGPYESVVIPVNEESEPTRFVRIGHAPISINTEKVIRVGTSAEPMEEQKAQDLEDKLVAQHILLNFERCDYTKGILERVEAFEKLMEARPDLQGKVQLVLQAEPTRTDIEEYRKYKDDVAAIVERINSKTEYSVGDHPPIVFMNESLKNEDLLKIINRTKQVGVDENGAAIMQRRIGTITPHEDGMNLTAKECAAVGGGCVIVSKGAGAAAELNANGLGAITYDPKETPENPAPLVNAMIKAIDMSDEEAKQRAAVMRECVKANTIQHWGKHMKNESDIILDNITKGNPMPGVSKLSEYQLEL